MRYQNLKTSPEISERMKALSHKKSKVEDIFAKELWHRGYRYRRNYSKLPGSPDIVLTKYCIAIFVDGEFWHGKNFDVSKKYIHNNKEYWIKKIEKNIERDHKNDALLRGMGWIPLHYWSKDILNCLNCCIEDVESYIEIQKEGKESNFI